MESSSGPEADVDCMAPCLTTADLIQCRKAPLIPDTESVGESTHLKSAFICDVMSHASVIKVQHGNIFQRCSGG